MIPPGTYVFIYFTFIFVCYTEEAGPLHFLKIFPLQDVLYSLKESMNFPWLNIWLNLKLVLIFNNYSISPTQYFPNIIVLLISNCYLLTSILSFSWIVISNLLWLCEPILKCILGCILNIVIFTYLYIC